MHLPIRQRHSALGPPIPEDPSVPGDPPTVPGHLGSRFTTSGPVRGPAFAAGMACSGRGLGTGDTRVLPSLRRDQSVAEPAAVVALGMERQHRRLLAAGLHLLRGRLAHHRHRLGRRHRQRRPVRPNHLHLFLRRRRQLLDPRRHAAHLHVRALLHQAVPLLRVLRLLELCQEGG